MNFGEALQHMKSGGKAQRAGWNGKGMHAEAQPADANNTHPYLTMTIPECEEGTRRLPWQPAQVDLFAEDWEFPV